MSWVTLTSISVRVPSEERDAQAKEQARVVIGNIRTLLAECEEILAQADGFTSVGTWLPRLGQVEGSLEWTTKALAGAAGLVADAPATTPTSDQFR